MKYLTSHLNQVLLIASLGAVSLLFASVANAAPLNQVALYYRCYTQLTGQRPSDDDVSLNAIKNNGALAIDECLKLLDAARLQTSGSMVEPTNTTGVKVLNHLHSAHSTFFDSREFKVPSRDLSQFVVNSDLQDPTSPALYYTRALFTPSVRADSIVTGNDVLIPRRQVNDPTHAARSGQKKAVFAFNFFPENNFELAPVGQLTGFQLYAPTMMKTYPTLAAKTAGTPVTTVPWNETLGAGYLGTQIYLLKTVDQEDSFVSNVANLPRRWARSVVKDALCREFPMVRQSDATSFVEPTSSISFRGSSSCTQCHSTMDRVAMTLRGFSYTFGYHQNVQHKFPVHMKMTTATLPTLQAWPAEVDNDFSKRPPTGHLYFRTASDGSLVNVAVNNTADLGVKIAQQEDFYLCLANRYWNYFTGKGIKLDDNQTLMGLSKVERDRFVKIRALGLSLKNDSSQNLRTLVEQILRTPDYADSGFGP